MGRGDNEIPYRKETVSLFLCSGWELGVDTDRLRRAFVLIDPLHGLKNSDEKLLRLLRNSAISHQVILSKVDRIVFGPTRYLSEEKLQSNIAELRRICEQMRAKIQPSKSDGPEALGEIISCSADKRLDKEKKLGLDQVRWAVLAAAGFGDKKWRLSHSGNC